MYLQGYVKVRSMEHYKRVRATLKDLGYDHVASQSICELDAYRGLQDNKYIYVWFGKHGYMSVFSSYNVVKHGMCFKRKELVKVFKRHLSKDA